MAKFERFDPKSHLAGLAEAARQIRREREKEEFQNFMECMRFFQALQEYRSGEPEDLMNRIQHHAGAGQPNPRGRTPRRDTRPDWLSCSDCSEIGRNPEMSVIIHYTSNVTTYYTSGKPGG